MNGALSDAQKTDARRLGDEWVASHGPLLFTVWQQPEGRAKLRERLLESGRPDGVTSATWEQTIDLAMERINTSFTERPPSAMTPREAQSSADASRIHIEVRFLPLDIGLDTPVANVMRQRFHMPPGLPIEDDHARE